jgi:hypothetical protein
VGYLFILKEKIRRIGGCKGRLSRVYLTGLKMKSVYKVEAVNKSRKKEKGQKALLGNMQQSAKED